MNTPFAITTSVSTLDVTPGTPAPVNVTVTNQTGRPVQGVAKVVTTPTVPPEWVTVDFAERALATDGTQAFVLTVHVPAGTAAGTFTVRLDVVDRDNPDDVGATGQDVAVRVAAYTPPPEPRRKGSGYLAAVVGTTLGALAGGALGFAIGLLLFEDAVENSGDTISEAIGGTIGGVILLMLTIMLLGYVLACAGCGIALRVRRHARPWLTAALLILALPVWATLCGALMNALGEPDALGPVLLLSTFVAPPLGARALVVRTLRRPAGQAGGAP